MADFRRVVTALAVLALLTGFAVTANAQATGPAFSCTASAAVPPLLRAEGLTELTGDIVLNCSGGVTVPAGQTIPNIANITVFLGNTTVTSRILDTKNGTNASEALLLIDEPHTALNAAPFNPCGPDKALIGCAPYTSGSTPNAFQGVVSGNSVTFIGIPINPPGSTGTRIFRITNVRANAAAIGAGAGPGGTPGQVQAFISISGSTSIPINNPTQIVGFVQSGLSFAVRKADDFGGSVGSDQTNFAQCDTSFGKSSTFKNTPRAVLQFTEGFATAFKPRVAKDASGNPSQAVPGTVFNTESGLIMNTGNFTGGSSVLGTATAAGLADTGTRLRATFANIPTGVTLFVTTSNILDIPSFIGVAAVGATGLPNTAPIASLVTSEIGGVNATPTATDFGGVFGGKSGATGQSFAVVPVSLNNGGGTAVWEVSQSNPLGIDEMNFGLYLSFSANPGTNTPAAGVTGTVAGSFAPAPPTIDATAGAKASSSLPIPRFIDTGSPKTLIVINICRTNLLFPFVTSKDGFDTGLAIANTSLDVFGTKTQQGDCTLTPFADGSTQAATTPKTVKAGQVQTWLASTDFPGFTGYVIAQCNFQFGHGFAFVSDLGARNLAMGYLALVMDKATIIRGGSTGEGLTQ